MNLALLIESRRERDLNVINKLAQVADRDYRWKEYIPEDHPDYIYKSVLELMRVFPRKEISVPSGTQCSLEWALHFLEDEGILRQKNLALDRGLEVLKEIANRYQMQKIDRNRLSAEDRKRVEEIEEKIILPAEREWQFIDDMEHVKLMARTAALIYEADRQDVAMGGGDINAIGQSIVNMAKRKELDEETTIAIVLWRKINEKVPAPITKEFEDLRKAYEGVRKQKR